jgi:hypothetical protein
MNRVVSVRNQYHGINAHLHSYLQATGKWSDFHVRHIPYLANALQKVLLPLGYITSVETSLQCDAPYRAISIAPLDAESLEEGDPVVWIELLSPSNKGESEDALHYREKRMDLLAAGLVFVEIDYLHETPPAISTGTISGYFRLHMRQRYPEITPYRIVMIDPRPTLEQGIAQIAGFGVDEPIPALRIPLNGDDFIQFDFEAVYQKTFEESYYGSRLDYRELPRNFERYLPGDQQRIVARMCQVLEALHAGLDLETASFPPSDESQPLPALDDLFLRLAALKPA